jgi:hypothetical protein
MTGARVNIDNFVRAETDRMFAAILHDAGGVNQWVYMRKPTPADHQPVIRQNRDTLYSASVIDISKGATVTLPDGGGRYLSLMVVNQDHYINTVLHTPGEHKLTTAEFGTPYVMAAVRVLIDPADPQTWQRPTHCKIRWSSAPVPQSRSCSPSTTRRV